MNADKTIRNARKRVTVTSKSYYHHCPRDGKRASNRARRALDKALCRSN
jgi:hypothetical protein